MTIADTKPVPAPIKILIVDDHHLVREGLRARLELNEKVQIVGEAADGESATRLAETLDPDIVFMDISMQGMGGFDAARKILENSPDAKIVFLSMYDNPEYISEAVRIGAKGYLLKDISREDMNLAIDAIHGGGIILGPGAASALSNDPSSPSNKYDLTVREIEILRFIADGKSNREISDLLSISIRTVESHRLSIRRKTGGGNAAALAQLANELGLRR